MKKLISLLSIMTVGIGATTGLVMGLEGTGTIHPHSPLHATAIDISSWSTKDGKPQVLLTSDLNNWSDLISKLQTIFKNGKTEGASDLSGIDNHQYDITVESSDGSFIYEPSDLSEIKDAKTVTIVYAAYANAHVSGKTDIQGTATVQMSVASIIDLGTVQYQGSDYYYDVFQDFTGKSMSDIENTIKTDFIKHSNFSPSAQTMALADLADLQVTLKQGDGTTINEVKDVKKLATAVFSVVASPSSNLIFTGTTSDLVVPVTLGTMNDLAPIFANQYINIAGFDISTNGGWKQTFQDELISIMKAQWISNLDLTTNFDFGLAKVDVAQISNGQDLTLTMQSTNPAISGTSATVTIHLVNEAIHNQGDGGYTLDGDQVTINQNAYTRDNNTAFDNVKFYQTFASVYKFLGTDQSQARTNNCVGIGFLQKNTTGHVETLAKTLSDDSANIQKYIPNIKDGDSLVYITGLANYTNVYTLKTLADGQKGTTVNWTYSIVTYTGGKLVADQNHYIVDGDTPYFSDVFK